MKPALLFFDKQVMVEEMLKNLSGLQPMGLKIWGKNENGIKVDKHK